MWTLMLICAAALAQTAPYPAPPGPADVRFDAFVPLPGYPSLRQGDIRGFGLSWAVVVPSTTALVLTANGACERPRQLALASVVSYYASTVAANQLVPLLRSDVKLGLVAEPSSSGLTVSLNLSGW